MHVARVDASVERYTETMFGSRCLRAAVISDIGTPARSIAEATLCLVIRLPLTRPSFCIPASTSIFFWIEFSQSMFLRFKEQASVPQRPVSNRSLQMAVSLFVSLPDKNRFSIAAKSLSLYISMIYQARSRCTGISYEKSSVYSFWMRNMRSPDMNSMNLILRGMKNGEG